MPFNSWPWTSLLVSSSRADGQIHCWPPTDTPPLRPLSEIPELLPTPHRIPNNKQLIWGIPRRSTVFPSKYLVWSANLSLKQFLANCLSREAVYLLETPLARAPTAFDGVFESCCMYMPLRPALLWPRKQTSPLFFLFHSLFASTKKLQMHKITPLSKTHSKPPAVAASCQDLPLPHTRTN